MVIGGSKGAYVRKVPGVQEMLRNVLLCICGPEWIWYLGSQTLQEAEKSQGLFRLWGGNSRKANSKEM